MSSWDNPYSTPEAYGLRTVGEVDFSDGAYQFDYTVVWQTTATGALYYADDAGCSCPSPFEDHDITDLVLVERLQDLIDHLSERHASANSAESVRAAGECAQLILKAREALHKT